MTDGQTAASPVGGVSFPGVPDVLGRSPAFRALTVGLVDWAATPDALVLVGEPGTGKRMLAHAVHQVSRQGGPLLVLDCAELPEPALARVLLGRPGSQGLLEVSGDATLLLLHVDGLGNRLERRLLRRLEATAPDTRPRLLGTLNRPTLGADAISPLGGALHTLFEDRQFEVPPLRHRDEDLELLTDHFLQLFAPGGSAPSVTSAARFALQSHRWPGNVRELRSVIRQAAEVGDEVRPETLPIKTRTRAFQSVAPPVAPPTRAGLEGRSLKDIEAEAIKATLSLTKGNRSAAAKLLGISRPTLLRKIKSYEIDR